ncbi:GNAT family N-acetyltransferase [Polymorphobacter fuscus]|uniref:GNAT family N-acetyltransferase n=1 Tax=Sandarakinorhabdus fusca TaxID=1439888 RepID=A0A7C9GM91_9SPHN|nr:GNAT family N-acetyltransferase [Polymorphobacter fuscus]KAB7648305.1 GNAT family N-acetyltransferase [Polymorphobacter fuscus]MQT15817.1 GNAT family N-acetyltransferase [Polymorphobacter fuscus]NJC07909.1 RimJ/RimL family protein N-acetyltransferase [Polymorphobacter fuscus]
MITTERLILRPWCDADAAPFHAMGRDPEVMRFLGPLQTPAETDAAIARMVASQAAHGHCFWAVERLDTAGFIGFCGLKHAPDGIAGLAGDIEIGWRLARPAWGQGFAREAATASLDWGFTALAIDRIIAITTAGNVRSWGLMERLGMARRHDLDFDHPALPAGDPLRPHITYAIGRPGSETIAPRP